MLVTEDELNWLREEFPNLIANADRTEIRGDLQFCGIYNSATGKFRRAYANCSVDTGEECLCGSFLLTIEYRSSALPAVYIAETQVPRHVDRHINVKDGTACLCGPSEEMTLLAEGLSFQQFIEKLVTPFLYGQLFYDKYARWPWPERAHGAIGLFEEYLSEGKREHLSFLLEKLQLDNTAWQSIRKELARRKTMKGHRPCICRSGKQIRKCHPNAWKGFLRFQSDLRVAGIDF